MGDGTVACTWYTSIHADGTLMQKMKVHSGQNGSHCVSFTSDKSLSYTDRLQKFGLTTLETRRLRGYLIEVFKMFKGFDNITLNDFSSYQAQL